MGGNALNDALGAARGAKKVVEFSMSQMPRKLALLYSVSPDVHNGVRGAKSFGIFVGRRMVAFACSIRKSAYGT